MKKLRVAVVAAGFIGKQHIEAIRRLPGTEVVAVAETGAASLPELGEELGVAGCYWDYKEMLEREKPDIVHNCSPNSLHYAVNRFALEKGVHVYCEKPLAVTVEQGKELVKLAEKQDLACGVNFNYRNNAMVREMRARLASGNAGRLFLVHGAYLQDWLMRQSDYNWRFEPENAGGSRALADIGSHWFDLVQMICGQRIDAVNADLFITYPTRIKPAATSQTFSGGGTAGQPVPVTTEDGGFIQAKLEDGTRVGVVLSQVSGGYKNHIQISVDCEGYSMRWQQQHADQLVLGMRDGGEHTLYAEPALLSEDARRFATLPGGHCVAWADALRNSISEFYAAVRDKRYSSPQTSYATFADAVQIMNVVKACLESGRTGQWTQVAR